MKKYLFLFMTLIALDSFGQFPAGPMYILNGDTIDLQVVFINPTSIDEIHVDKTSPTGTISMITKKKVVFATLLEVLEEYTELKDSGTIVYSIDGKIVKDKAAVRIDRSYFLGVQTHSLFDVGYLDESLRSLVIVEIKLSTKMLEQPQVRIRGVRSINVD